MDAEHRMKKTMWGQFWSAHQRFFKYLCISAKVNACVRLARDAVKNGKVSYNQMHLSFSSSCLDNDTLVARANRDHLFVNCRTL